MLQGSLLLGHLQGSQLSLLKVQQQLSSGQRLNQASDDPAAALGIQSLRRQLSINDTYSASLEFAGGFLSQIDSSLGDASSLVNQAQSIASSQVGADSTPDERAAQAEVVNSLLQRALTIANTRYRGQAVFGGQDGIQDPFAPVGGGYKYQGTTSQQTLLGPGGNSLTFSLSGDTAFGAVSSQVIGYRNLGPALTTATRLADLQGATGKGITAGPIDVTIGATTVSVDLSQAATVGDVINTINAALTANGSNGSVSIAGGSFMVVGDSTQNITFSDPQNGTTAASLGLTGTAPAASSTTFSNVRPLVTPTTTLASLRNGAGIDPAGITISNGANTATITLAGPPALTTVEDLLNAINNSGTNVQARLNAAGTGIDLLNPLSGTAMRIGENGGNTADQLGIRSLNAQTNLADLNASTGITPIANTLAGPTGQIVITRTDGTTFNVQVDGVSTPSQLIAAINSASGNTTVTAALNASGNGITLVDTAGGSGNLAVAPGANYIGNGTDLGLFKSGAGGTLAGSNITFSTDDFRITRRDGTSFTVGLKGAVTIQDVLDRINNADGNTAAGTKVTASLNPNGNGIQLSDASTGSGSLAVTSVNASPAAAQLGILKASATGTIAGDDTNPLQPQGLFSSLMLLRDSLLQNDSAGIQRAASLLQKDGARIVKVRGTVGAREQDVSGRKDDLTGEQTQLKQALSLLADTDFTEAATRFQQLQTAYSAGLQVAQTATNTSLLDFLK